jgi:hypothetical protein
MLMESQTPCQLGRAENRRMVLLNRVVVASPRVGAINRAVVLIRVQSQVALP